MKQAKETMPGSLEAEPKLKANEPKAPTEKFDHTDKIAHLPAKDFKPLSIEKHGKTIHSAEMRPDDFRDYMRKNVIPNKYRFKSPDGSIDMEIYFEPDKKAIERLGGREKAIEEYIDHFISSGGKYEHIRHLNFERGRMLGELPNLFKDPDMIVEGADGSRYFVRKYKDKRGKDLFHFSVGRIDSAGDVREVTAFAQRKKLKIDGDKVIYIKHESAPYPDSSAVGAGSKVPGPVAPSDNIVSQDGVGSQGANIGEKPNVVENSKNIGTKTFTPPTAIDSTGKTLYFKENDAKTLKEMGVGIRNVNIPGRKGQVSVNKKMFENAVKKIERGEVPGTPGIKPEANTNKIGKTPTSNNNTPIPEIETGKDPSKPPSPSNPPDPKKINTPTITKAKGEKPTITFPEKTDGTDGIAGADGTVKLHAGFNPIGDGDNVAKETWGKIKSWFKSFFNEAGNADDLTKKNYVGTMEDIKEGQAVATEIAEDLIYKQGKKPKFGKAGDIYSQEAQQMSGAVVKGEYTNVNDFIRDTKGMLTPDEAKDLFSASMRAQEEQSLLSDKLIELGVAPEEVFRNNQGSYMGRMYRKYEYHNMRAEQMLETAKRMLKPGGVESQKWSEALQRLANNEKHQALRASLQETIQNIKGDTSLWSATKKPGYTYVRGEDYLFGDKGLSGLYVRDDQVKAIREMMNQVNLSKQKLGKYFGQGRTELAKGLDGSYLKRRKDLSEETREALGEILEPAYPVAKRIAQMKSDVAKHTFYKYIADNFGDVNNIGADMVKFDGKKWGSLDGKYVPKQYADLVKDFANESSKLAEIYNNMTYSLLHYRPQ